MKSRRFAVGDRVEKFCKVCIEERGHVVASVSVRGRVSRVTCPNLWDAEFLKASRQLPDAHKTNGPVEHYDQAHTYPCPPDDHAPFLRSGRGHRGD